LAPFNKPIDTLEKTTSGVSTPPGYGDNSQTGSETGNPAKKIKHDPEQHIPDEILNDLYGVSYSSNYGLGGGAREDDQDNQEVPELDTKDNAFDDTLSKPLDMSKSNKTSRKQPNPGRLHSMSSSSSHNRSLDDRVEHINTSSSYPGGNGKSPQVFSPVTPTGVPNYPAGYPSGAYNPLSFAQVWHARQNWPGVNTSMSKGPHYHPYSNNSKSSSSSKVDTQPKSLGSSSLDALNSCVNSLNPNKVSPSLPTAKPKADATVKTEPQSTPSTSKDISPSQNPQSSTSSGGKNDKSDDPVPAHKRGGVQLWQFLRQLLDNPERRNIIHWTRQGHDGEFKLLDPEEVARLWGCEKKRPAMNYDKLSRSIRYYYEKGIMQKVPGERYVYKFLPDTMQAVHPFSNQLALGYNQPDVTWPAHFPNPAVPNAQMPTGFHHPSIHDYYANPQMAQQLLALQQYQHQAAEQYNSGTGLPSYPTFGWPNANWNPNQPNPYSEN